MITGKFKIPNEAGKRKAKQAYLFYLLFYFPLKNWSFKKFTWCCKTSLHQRIPLRRVSRRGHKYWFGNSNKPKKVFLNSDDVISDENKTKGVMFKWTLTGLEVAKRILLENGYIEKVDEKYIANSEKIAEFKKNYKKVK